MTRDTNFVTVQAMRRLMALVALLVFAAATAAPAMAACRGRAAQPACCCDPAPANSLCAPDCCARLDAAPPLGQVSPSLRGFGLFSPPRPARFAHVALSSPLGGRQRARWLVGLHQRAAPRLPLRL